MINATWVHEPFVAIFGFTRVFHIFLSYLISVSALITTKSGMNSESSDNLVSVQFQGDIELYFVRII